MQVLTEGDIAICHVIAGLRTSAARIGMRDKQFSLEYGKHNLNELNGVIAEYYFCKKHNVFFDAVFGGRDVGYDCIVNHKRIDIKAIDDGGLNLICNLESKGEADIYVLILVQGYGVKIMGWIDADTLHRDENIKDMGHGERYVMATHDLKAWSKQ